jgi:hypothetical protein
MNMKIEGSARELHPMVPNFLADHPPGLVLVGAHPLVRLHLLEGEAALRVLVEDLPDELDDPLREVDGELDFDLQDFVVGFVLIGLRLEGRPPCVSGQLPVQSS